VSGVLGRYHAGLTRLALASRQSWNRLVLRRAPPYDHVAFPNDPRG
jgi:hypothetical protein